MLLLGSHHAEQAAARRLVRPDHEADAECGDPEARTRFGQGADHGSNAEHDERDGDRPLAPDPVVHEAE